MKLLTKPRGINWPWRTKPVRYGVASIADAYLEDMRRPKRIMERKGQRRKGGMSGSA